MNNNYNTCKENEENSVKSMIYQHKNESPDVTDNINDKQNYNSYNNANNNFLEQENRELKLKISDINNSLKNNQGKSNEDNEILNYKVANLLKEKENSNLIINVRK